MGVYKKSLAILFSVFFLFQVSALTLTKSTQYQTQGDIFWVSLGDIFKNVPSRYYDYELSEVGVALDAFDDSVKVEIYNASQLAHREDLVIGNGLKVQYQAKTAHDVATFNSFYVRFSGASRVHSFNVVLKPKSDGGERCSYASAMLPISQWGTHDGRRSIEGPKSCGIPTSGYNDGWSNPHEICNDFNYSYFDHNAPGLNRITAYADFGRLGIDYDRVKSMKLGAHYLSRGSFHSGTRATLGVTWAGISSLKGTVPVYVMGQEDKEVHQYLNYQNLKLAIPKQAELFFHLNDPIYLYLNRLSIEVTVERCE